MQLTRQTDPTDYVERGVYRATFRSKRGRPIMLAIGRDQCVVAWKILRPGLDPELVGQWLWQQLDLKDPLPRIALVRDDEVADPSDVTPLSPAALAAYYRYRPASA